MSYGVKASDLFSDLAVYVDRILKGASPSDLPIQRPTTFELVINAKTAKALGLTMPPTLLATAHEPGPEGTSAGWLDEISSFR